jgi:Putative prokaryotic signal transducing protein
MRTDDFAVVYSGNIVQADLLKSVLDDSGIQAMLEDEYIGRMYPYAIPGGVKVIVPNAELDEARRIVEKLLSRPDIRLVE